VKKRNKNKGERRNRKETGKKEKGEE